METYKPTNERWPNIGFRVENENTKNNIETCNGKRCHVHMSGIVDDTFTVVVSARFSEGSR